MEKIHSNHAKGFLLLDVRFVEQTYVDNNLVWLPTRLKLKSHAQPAMRFVALFETARRDRVGENKKRFLGAEFSVEPFDEEIVFVIEHCLETHTADIAVRRSINGIAECHVVGRHRFRDRAGCAAYPKESARDLLASAISAKVPYLAESRLIRRAFSSVPIAIARFIQFL